MEEKTEQQAVKPAAVLWSIPLPMVERMHSLGIMPESVGMFCQLAVGRAIAEMEKPAKPKPRKK